MKLPSPALLGYVFLGSEILLAVAKRARRETAESDASSLRVLWIVITLSVLAGIQATVLWHAPLLPSGHTYAAAGLVLFLAGLALRWYSIVRLGRFFTVNVAIAADHQPVDSGPYRFIRHPSCCAGR